MSITRIAHILISVTILGFLLITLKSFLVPLILAIAIWLIIRNFRQLIMSSKYVRVPYWLGTVLASIVIIGILSIFGQLLGSQIKSFLEPENLDKYNTNFIDIKNDVVSWIGVDMLNTLLEKIQDFDIAGMVQVIIGALSGILGDSIMILLYLLFLILEENQFKFKLNLIYKDESKREQVMKTIGQITESVESYVTLKTVVSLITGFASYLALLILGVDFPIFWALLIFFLNYIPTVGSLVATVFPAVMALIEFQELSIFFYVLIIIGIIQLVVGNVIEPRIMGNSLNISPLIVILSLTFWGYLWGIVGMIISVPIMVVLIIIFSKIKATKNVAIMLSSNGKV